MNFYAILSIFLESKRAEYDMTRQQLRGLKENMGEIFEGTMEELKTQIELYNDILAKKTDRIEEVFVILF